MNTVLYPFIEEAFCEETDRRVYLKWYAKNRRFFENKLTEALLPPVPEKNENKEAEELSFSADAVGSYILYLQARQDARKTPSPSICHRKCSMRSLRNMQTVTADIPVSSRSDRVKVMQLWKL